MSGIILAAAYLTGAIGIWRMGPLRQFDEGGWHDVSPSYRVWSCVVWPVTLLQMWEP